MKFEYAFDEAVSRKEMEKKLNERAADGWELVEVGSRKAGGNLGWDTFPLFWKRPVE